MSQYEILKKRYEEVDKLFDEYMDAQPPMTEHTTLQDLQDYRNKNPYKKELATLEREMRMLKIPTMEPFSNIGDLMTLKQFLANVRSGGFIDYDGSGNYATATEESNISIYPSDVKNKSIRTDFTHVVWYNR